MKIEQEKLFEDQPAQNTQPKDFPFLRWLGTGKDQAISMKFYARILNTDARTLRTWIHNARLCGHVIIGDDAGYYLPSCEEEVSAWISREECALRSKARALQSARQALKDEVYERSDCTEEV